MVRQVLDFLRPGPGLRFCDLTIGEGGHAEKILERSSPDGTLVGIDRDGKALEVAARRLGARFSRERFELIHTRFSKLRSELESRGLGAGFHGILADFGVSSFQLDDPARGFAFSLEGPLDMRMNQEQATTAAEVIKHWDSRRLAAILADYGEERHAGKIARAIRDAARAGGIETTTELADVARRAVGWRRGGGIDSATRVFQAIRIAVNGELDEIAALLESARDCLLPGGTLVCIAYHSLEDRLVKQALAAGRRAGWLELLTPKPLQPDEDEIRVNRRSRSARLRACRRREET